MRVTAVDPAAMHPTLLVAPGFRHLRMNASEAKFRHEAFELLVCDMSWDPLLMAQLVKEHLSALVPGGTVITTVKLMHGKPFATLREVERTFAPLLRLKQAKQLFHNREELTCCWVRTETN
jgi:23S rRNA (cytidine2498-2'-O)-methyltransferase